MNYLKQPRTKKTYKEKSFSPKTIEAAMKRDKESCRICGVCFGLDPLHHIFFRSELYSDIINKLPNASVICSKCHQAITNPTKDNKGREYDKQLKGEAIREFIAAGTDKSEVAKLQQIYRGKGYGLYV